MGFPTSTACMAEAALFSELAVPIKLVVLEADIWLPPVTRPWCLLPHRHTPGTFPRQWASLRGVVQALAPSAPTLCADGLSSESLGIDTRVDISPGLVCLSRHFTPKVLVIDHPCRPFILLARPGNQ